MRSMLWMIPLSLLMACGGKDDTGGADDSASGDDSGTADDSGADDSSQPDGPNGRWEGLVIFNVEDASSGESDQCEGELVIEVNMEDPNEQFFGEFQCTFSGFLMDFSPMQGSVYGLISTFGEIAGSYETGEGPIQGEWAGTFDETDGFYGAFEGTGSAMGFDLSWAGEFTASR